MIKIYAKGFPLDHPEEVEKEIQYYIDNKWEILSMTSESCGQFGRIMAVMKRDEAPNPWLGRIVWYEDMLYEVVECTSEPTLVFDDGSKHYVMKIKPIEGYIDSNYWIKVNDAQVELVED